MLVPPFLVLVTSVILPTLVFIVASDTAGEGESNEVHDDVSEAVDATSDAESNTRYASRYFFT